MSIDIIPLRVWQENTLQNHIPANDNALRQEVMVRPCLGVANDEAGGDQDGDVWIVGDTPTGAFASFDENDVAMLRQGNWYAWKPFEGMRLVVAGVRKVFDSGAWIDDPSITGGGSGDVGYTIVTEATAFTATPGTHDGLTRYNRAGGDVTFDSAQPYTAGMVFNIRATGAVELIEDGVTLTPQAGGTLELTAGMAVQVVMTSATAADVIGQTVPA